MACGAAYAVECLLLVLYGEEAENHGGVAVGIECCDALGDGLADLVEVWGVAADHAAEHYHGVVT